MRIPCTDSTRSVARAYASPNEDEAAAIAQVMNAIRLLRTRWSEPAPADAGTLAQLREENAVLGRELAAVQRRTTRLVHQQAQTIDTLRAAVVRLRAELIVRDTLIAALREQVQPRTVG
jgi:hypothetical protein